MPLTRVADTFGPRQTRFDVVIIDEASQSDPLGLLAFYLGRKVVVVGDHEQVSPAAVGYDAQMVDNLIAVHLPEIPNSHLYDPKTSVYDLAGQSFGDTICLVEHFRCVPEIIQFSNQLAYDGRIRPLRDGSQVTLRPHVIGYRVEGTRSVGKVNEEEVWAVASLLAAAVEQPEYAGRSFGVISLVGEDQALEIERLLRQRVEPCRYEAHRIVCGNAAHFQGDERDVMFLSVVDSRGDGPLPIQQRDDFKQRLNVAASRARDQMWVVYSLDPRSDLKAGDLRRRLIEHAENPLAMLQAMAQQEQRAESEFEKEVLRRLIRAGYRVRSQCPVGHYRIDLVVEGGGRRLAIECDGDRYHPLEKLAEDMARQAVLERLGWRFVRIRGSSFYRDPEAVMGEVFGVLERLGIPPEPPDGQGGTLSALWDELRERVVRRAAELRRDWREEADALAADDILLSRGRRPSLSYRESRRAEA
jgi:very-short-patch-repair endonuclease